MLYSPPSMLKTFLQKISGDGGLRVPQENCLQYVSLLAFGYWVLPSLNKGFTYLLTYYVKAKEKEKIFLRYFESH